MGFGFLVHFFLSYLADLNPATRYAPDCQHAIINCLLRAGVSGLSQLDNKKMQSNFVASALTLFFGMAILRNNICNNIVEVRHHAQSENHIHR